MNIYNKILIIILLNMIEKIYKLNNISKKCDSYILNR